mmetsp:Transcript_19005/g.19744  ORF Transcript_19005/g.19744 Transcript_19005/m.19744 type:complete len:288 (-) Transcript_19005:111-974(-)|eukprot:CAMPEP_0174817892 /NCGR_PEP_ID=MMETSP1107-20130205/447_1 /TAXON_ID=36770 /ORGANISM="Paraphysomonas vestita, Strain GFlagA" /LENGTH=287 /DNA_ID=CAMNT_0016029001 /DNA_START=50 /DNA_END=913 /DNA_ORIENTATION=+
MVVFQIKKNDGDGFIYETLCDSLADDTVKEIAEIWNLRLRLGQLCGAIRELALYGPMKPPDKAGLDEIAEKYNNEVIIKNEYYQADPTGNRTGNGVGPQLTETIERVARDAEEAISKNNLTRKIATTLSLLQEKLDNIRGAVIMAYPMGLPEWDTVRLTIEGNHGLEGTAAGQELLDPNTAELWIASRVLDRTNNHTVADRLGRNEKTKVICKLQKPGGGAPGREPGVSEEEKKAMMAYYFKKQEEYKKLSENDEDSYINSSWADPKQLQRSLRGQNDSIRAPGVRR